MAEEISKLLLMSGNDVPFRTGRCTIHQPRIKEIAYIGEEAFQFGSRFLLFDKDKIDTKDKSGLENQSNFNIFMSVMNSRERAKHKTDALLLLALIFPNGEIKIEKDRILLRFSDMETGINEFNFEDFQNIIRQIFCLTGMDGGDSKYNPADGLANKIANKFKDREKKLSSAKGDNQELNIFGKYISILAVGLQKDINELMEYTVYQLTDEFKRFRAKITFDSYIQARLAGAQDLEEVENWME